MQHQAVVVVDIHASEMSGDVAIIEVEISKIDAVAGRRVLVMMVQRGQKSSPLIIVGVGGLALFVGRLNDTQIT